MLELAARLHEHLRIREGYLWLIPIGVAIAPFMLSEKVMLELMGACVALLFFVFLINRPGGTLIALLIFLPLEPVGFPLLYRLHIPGTFLHQASSLKELMGLAILVAGLRVIRDTGRHLDKIDLWLLLYVGAVTIYLIVPHLFSELAPTQLSARLLAWRTDAGYPLVFFGARHALFTPQLRERVIRVLLCLGALIGVMGLWQRFAGTSFSNFIMNTAKVAQYQIDVLHSPAATVNGDLDYVTQVGLHHITSILLSPYDLGDYMVIVGAVCAVHISNRHRSVLTYAVFGVAALNIWFTQVRGDAVAIGIVLVLVAAPASRTPVEGRIRLVAMLCVAGVLVVPNLAHSRFEHNAAASVSSQGHIYEIEDGLGIIYYEPLGLGLGQQPGVANRIGSLSKLINGGDISDNMITQVGDELGLQSMIPWLIMMGLVGWALYRRAGRDHDELSGAMGFAFLGIVIAGQTHHVFLTFPGPWTLWAGMGLALTANSYKEPEEPMPEQVLGPFDVGVR